MNITEFKNGWETKLEKLGFVNPYVFPTKDQDAIKFRWTHLDETNPQMQIILKSFDFFVEGVKTKILADYLKVFDVIAIKENLNESFYKKPPQYDSFEAYLDDNVGTQKHIFGIKSEDGLDRDDLTVGFNNYFKSNFFDSNFYYNYIGNDLKIEYLNLFAEYTASLESDNKFFEKIWKEFVVIDNTYPFGWIFKNSHYDDNGKGIPSDKVKNLPTEFFFKYGNKISDELKQKYIKYRLEYAWETVDLSDKAQSIDQSGFLTETELIENNINEERVFEIQKLEKSRDVILNQIVDTKKLKQQLTLKRLFKELDAVNRNIDYLTYKRKEVKSVLKGLGLKPFETHSTAIRGYSPRTDGDYSFSSVNVLELKNSKLALEVSEKLTAIGVFNTIENVNGKFITIDEDQTPKVSFLTKIANTLLGKETSPEPLVVDSNQLYDVKGNLVEIGKIITFKNSKSNGNSFTDLGRLTEKKSVFGIPLVRLKNGKEIPLDFSIESNEIVLTSLNKF